MAAQRLTASRIIVVSNRLPFTIENGERGIQFRDSGDGVATGLRTLLCPGLDSLSPASEYLWVGWPGNTISEEFQDRVRSLARSEFGCYPVFLPREEFENFYQGFCNKTIWPLFHYFPANARYQNDYWTQYQKVNETFSATLLQIARPEDTVWIHDYHLMLLPQLLRNALPAARIGFFLHIPFPHFEIFRLLPVEWRREILEGLLGADLVGFQTHDYAEYFLRCVQRILGHEHHMGQLTLDRTIKVEAFPMGIDYRMFHDAASSIPLQSGKEDLHTTLGNCKVILSLDRQDYSKGILHRLLGFEAMLVRYPEWRGRVTLIMIVIPSRIGIDDYEEMKKQIEELVSRINGEFGTFGWIPIIYQYRALQFQSLVALYAMSHVALVTPLRDGLNLVAKEYIATRVDKTGVLVLSEMSGAAKELPEAILINPNNREEIAGALKSALEMPPEEQARRNEIMQNRLRRYDVSRWAMDFFVELLSIPGADEQFRVKGFSGSARQQLIREYHQKARRLLVLDYDGTLVPCVAPPGRARPAPELLNLLRALADDPCNEVVLATGRDRATLEQWFKGLPIGLAAEHGIYVKEREGSWTILKSLDVGWKELLFPILETYADRVAGAFVEEKEFSLVWHYRAADGKQADAIAMELTDHLLAITANIDLHVSHGSNAIEVKPASINKGIAVQHWLSANEFEFILTIGDDWTDEEMFAALPENAFSIRVGIARTHARFNLSTPNEVIRLLETLVVADNAAPTSVEKRMEITPVSRWLRT